MSDIDPKQPRVIMLQEQSQQQQPLEQEQQQHAPTARSVIESARISRTASRVTLQPSVQDFNGNIINKALANEDQLVWLTGSKTQGKFQPAVTGDLYAFPVPASFRGSVTFGPQATDLVSLTHGRLPNVPPLNRHDRTTAWSDEVHRRHVVRTARVRRCLSPKQKRAERAIPAATPVSVGGSGVGGLMHYDSDSTFSLTLPFANGDSLNHMDDIRLATTNYSRGSSRNDNQFTSRYRPATTGRYFDTSNGLRNLRSSPVVLRSRPVTAAPWSGSGLKIKKVVLHPKELMME